MSYEKEHYKQEFNKLINRNHHRKFFIKKSKEHYKINKFRKKGIDSLSLAFYIHTTEEKAKDYG